MTAGLVRRATVGLVPVLVTVVPVFAGGLGAPAAWLPPLNSVSAATKVLSSAARPVNTPRSVVQNRQKLFLGLSLMYRDDPQDDGLKQMLSGNSARRTHIMNGASGCSAFGAPSWCRVLVAAACRGVASDLRSSGRRASDRCSRGQTAWSRTSRLGRERALRALQGGLEGVPAWSDWRRSTRQNADERTRTSTSLRTRRPERRASTNSATSACRGRDDIAPGPHVAQRPARSTRQVESCRRTARRRRLMPRFASLDGD